MALYFILPRGPRLHYCWDEALLRAAEAASSQLCRWRLGRGPDLGIHYPFLRDSPHGGEDSFPNSATPRHAIPLLKPKHIGIVIVESTSQHSMHAQDAHTSCPSSLVEEALQYTGFVPHM